MNVLYCVCLYVRDRCHAPVNLNVVHGTIMSFVEMEKFKTKQSTKVTKLLYHVIYKER